jgi:transcription antitermination protein NusB
VEEPAGLGRHRRRAARRKALEILYQADVTGERPIAVLDDLKAGGERVPSFARELVLGVGERLGELDALIGEHAEGWTVERMAVVDRNLLRLACFELLHRPDVPIGAAIAEAVEAANELSTSESGRFINGILGRIARERADGPR